MREFRSYGSMRGMRSNAHPYRDSSRAVSLNVSSIPLRASAKAAGHMAWKTSDIY